MPSAICPHCNEPAYSSAEFNRPWNCPTCGRLVIPFTINNPRPSVSLGKDVIIEQYSRFWSVEEPES